MDIEVLEILQEVTKDLGKKGVIVGFLLMNMF